MTRNAVNEGTGGGNIDPVPDQPSPAPEQLPLENGNNQSNGATAVPGGTLQAYGVNELPAAKSKYHTITIIGQIEGHLVLPSQNKTTKYEHLIPQLAAVEQDPDIEGLLLLLNTAGGDVEAGLAIAEMIRSLSKPAVSLVLGGGHSIGAPIAVAADYSFIAPTGTMTIHPIRMKGTVVGTAQTYDYLDQMQDRVVHFVVSNARISEKRYRQLMFRTGNLMRDIGSILVGEHAVAEGLIDDVGGINAASGKLEALIGEARASYHEEPAWRRRNRQQYGRTQARRLPREAVQVDEPGHPAGVSYRSRRKRRWQRGPIH